MIRLALLMTLACSTAHADNVMAVFTAKWCGPCQAYKRELRQYDLTPRLVFVDIDAHQALKARHRVQVIPTTIWFVNQREVARATGNLPIQKVRSMTHAALRQAKLSALGVAAIGRKAVAAVAGSIRNTPGDATTVLPHHN